MKKKLVSLLLALMLFVLSSCSSGGNNVSRTYDEALNAMKQGNYAQAADKLSSITFYEDSAELSLYCQAHAKAAEEDYHAAINDLQRLGSYRDAQQYVAYYTACYMEQTANSPAVHARAASYFEDDTIYGFRDSAEKALAIREALYTEAVQAEEDEDWDKAADTFLALGYYEDSFVRGYYAYGRQLEEKNDNTGVSTAESVKFYDDAADYRDASERKIQNLNTSFSTADKMIAAEEFDSAELIYQTLGNYCPDERLAALVDARKESLEKARLKKITDANALCASGKYDEARELYLEAEETGMAKEAMYLKADDLIKQGDTVHGASLFLELGDYKDSRDRHYTVGTAMQESNPHIARDILFEDREYPGASDALYDIAIRASENLDYELSISIYSEYQQERDCALRMQNDLYLYGQSLLEKGSNNEAASVFEGLSGVGFSDTYANMARYAAAARMEESGTNYLAAATAFAQIRDYEDAAEREQICKYKAALSYKAEGKFQRAADLFDELQEYKDSKAQLMETRYLQAGALMESGLYEQAITIYDNLGVYESSEQNKIDCYQLLGRQQLENGKPEDAYKSFVSANDADGMAEAAFAVGETRTTAMILNEALDWYILAKELPKTEERTAMIAQSLLNMEEDELSEAFASVVEYSEKSQAVLYALALRSLERKDEEAAMRQMKKAGDNADATERFQSMLTSRVESLISEGKFDDAVYLCSTYGDQARVDEIVELKVQAEKAEHEAKIAEADQLLAAGNYDDAISAYNAIGEPELASQAVAQKEAAEAEIKAQEKAAKLKAEEAEHQSKISEADQLLANGKYEEAISAYSAIGEADLARKAQELKEENESIIRAEEEAAQREAEKAKLEAIREREEEASSLLAAGKYEEAIQIYHELEEPEMVKEVIYQKASRTENPDLYLQILDYKDSREKHYLAGKALLESDPEHAFNILIDDITYSDTQSVLYRLANSESEKENYSLSSEVFNELSKQPLDPEELRGDCAIRSIQDQYLYGIQLQDSGRWEEAAIVFEGLENTGEAANRALECRYLVADTLEKEGKFTQAAAAFKRLGEYENSSYRMRMNQYYAAEKLMEDGKLEAAKKEFENLGRFNEASEKAKECGYQIATQLMSDGQWESARDAFAELGDYSDSEKKRQEAIYLIAGRFMKDGDYQSVIETLAAIPDYQDVTNLLSQCHSHLGDAFVEKADASLKTGNTERAIEDYSSAYQEYTLTNKTERTEQLALLIGDCYYSMRRVEEALLWFGKAGTMGEERIADVVDFAIKTEQYELAERLPSSLSDIIHYESAKRKESEGKYVEAIQEYLMANEYEDTKQKVLELITEKNLYSTLLGASVYIGSYFQGADGQSSTPIEWVVIDVDHAEATVLSRYGLNSMQYKAGSRTLISNWHDSNIREWLRNEFIQEAFTEKESNIILRSEIDFVKFYGFTERTSRVHEKIFLLDENEFKQYVANNSEELARCYPIDHIREDINTPEKTSLPWWLRNTHPPEYKLADVIDAAGELTNMYTNSDMVLVRPAMRIDLSMYLNELEGRVSFPNRSE